MIGLRKEIHGKIAMGARAVKVDVNVVEEDA
jgi:hypothetical protein